MRIFSCRDAIVVSVLVLSAPASAEPYYSTSQCDEVPASSGWHSKRGKVIKFWVESDIGDEMASCAPSGSPSTGMSDFNVRTVVKAAAETWNLESRANPLQYAGHLSDETVDDACSSMSVGSGMPRVFVHFRKGCYVKAGLPRTDANCGSLWAIVREADNCANAVEIEIFGDGNTANGCSGTELRDFRLDGESGHTATSRDLQAIIAHEFGHVLEIADDPEAPDDQSIMGQSSGGNSGRVGRRHLWPYDMDCVDDANIGSQRGERVVRYHYQGIKPDGTFHGSIMSGSQTAKGFLSGGFIRDGNGDEYYGRYQDTSIKYGVVNASGLLSFTTVNVFGDSIFDDSYTTPLIHTPLERNGVDQMQRMGFTKREDGDPLDPEDIDQIDPPLQRVGRSDDFFDSGNLEIYEGCSGILCTSSVDLQTHVPIVAAWNAEANRTVFVSVSTERILNEFYDPSLTGHGKISVHPGMYSSSDYRLREGSILSDHQTAPTAPSSYGGPGEPEWEYTLKTDVAPAVACAPDDDDREYNCLLAWVDRGIPEAGILYTYFRVNTTFQTVSWKPVVAGKNVWRRSGSGSVSHVSAAYFAGKFWMAWKSDNANSDLEYTHTTGSTCYTCWSTVSDMASDVVDPPTWLYVADDSSLEAGLIWTEHEDG